MPKKKKSQAFNDDFEDIGDNPIRDGAWKVFAGKNSNSYTNTRSAATKNAMKTTPTSAVFDVLTGGGSVAASAAGNGAGGKLVSSTAMAKLEECFLASKLLLSVDNYVNPNDTINSSNAPVITTFERFPLVDGIVDVLLARMREALPTVAAVKQRNAADDGHGDLFIPVDFLLLGVGELDSAPSCLQMALGMAIAKRLHGMPLAVVCAVDDEDLTPKAAPNDFHCRRRRSVVIIRSLVTYDPMIKISTTPESTSDATPSTTAKASTGGGGGGGLEGYIRRWNNLAHDAQISYQSKLKEAAKKRDEVAEVREEKEEKEIVHSGDTLASVLPLLLPPLPPLTYDSENRFGAYSVGCGRSLSHQSMVEGRGGSAQNASQNDQLNGIISDADADDILIAFTPHCPRALYHNLIVHNTTATRPPLATATATATEGGTDHMIDTPAGNSEKEEGRPTSRNTRLRRLIIIGNNIVGYTRHDKRCVMEGLRDVSEGARGGKNSTNSGTASSFSSNFSIVHNDLRSMLLTRANCAVNATAAADVATATKEEGLEFYSDYPPPMITVTAIEKLLQEAASRTSVEAKYNDLVRNMPKAAREQLEAAAAANGTAGGGSSSSCLCPSNTARRASKYVSILSRGKYGPHTAAEAERAFGDLCIVSFGPSCEAVIVGGRVGEKEEGEDSFPLLPSLPPSKRRIITSGDDLL